MSPARRGPSPAGSPKTGEIGILGSGGWGTALAILLARHGRAVRLWARNPETALSMTEDRENRVYLPGQHLPEGLTVTSNLVDLAEAEVLLAAVPTQGLRGVLEMVRERLAPRPLVLACKGLELATGHSPSGIAAGVLGRDFPLAILSGPNRAKEVAEGLPAAAVLGRDDQPLWASVQELLTTASFRLYGSADRRGVELGGALKNVMAIAVGLTEGLALGDNARAAVLTRGMAELARLGEGLGGRRETFFGLSGLGDLVVTGMSSWSRNRRLGFFLGQGQSLEEAAGNLQGLAVEGWPTTRVAYEHGRRLRLPTPIIDEVYAILYEGKPPADCIASLMNRGRPEERREG